MKLSESPCYKVESAILKESLCYIASAAEQQCIPKEELLKKMVQEALKARDWDMSSFFENLSVSQISVREIAALFHVANLSQRQYQMCRNLLIKYGINAFPPRNDIDSYKITLYPTVKSGPLSASVGVKELFDSTLFDIIDNELLSQSIGEMSIDDFDFQVKAGLDGSGSHKKRQQLSGDEDDDRLIGNSDSFVGVFMTPMLISVDSGDQNVVPWQNPTPNSTFRTRPIHLYKAKEPRSFVEEIFTRIQAAIDSFSIPHHIEGLSHKAAITTKMTMVDGKMVNILQGDSGSFCHYCDIKRDEASDFHHIASLDAGGMPITKTIEECKSRWNLVESGEIGYRDPLRAGQCHKPLISHSGRFFGILHQVLRSLDFALKILYHLVVCQKLWSEVDHHVKSDVAAAKVRVIDHIKASCHGLLVDSPTVVGGSTNTGPVANRFFAYCNRTAICSIIDDMVDRENYSILLAQMNVCLSVSESVDTSKSLNADKLKIHCHETMLYITLHFPWVRITPSVHQMLAHTWELFEITEGGPIAVWSESAIEAWNKHVRNFRSGAGCRVRQNSVKSNINDTFVRMLITSAPAVAKVRDTTLKKKRQGPPLLLVMNEEEALLDSIYS